MKYGFLRVTLGVSFLSLSHSAMAALLDFTDSGLVGSLTTVANGYRGTIDGVGFTITSTNGTVNFKEAYDGTAKLGCQSSGGALKCNKDGAGIADDEVTGGTEALTLRFDTAVNVSAFHFLDLYVNPDGSGAKEQATITIDGALFNTMNATGLNGNGGYALLSGSARGQTFRFTGASGKTFWDDQNNDYALAGVNVSAVPLPAAAWFFGTGMAAMIGLRRSRRVVEAVSRD